MSPHRLTVVGRYKISDDILILILEKLDLQSLLAVCKVSTSPISHAALISRPLTGFQTDLRHCFGPSAFVL